MRIMSFKGQVPRIPYRSSGFDVATSARDVDLSRGTLCPWGSPKVIAQKSGTASFHQHGCCTLMWDTCVVAEGWLPTSNRIFLTGRSAYPETAAIHDCTPQYFRLGVPAPEGAPVISFSSGGISKASDERAYAYTYVNAFGEEGPPSFPSSTAPVVDGTTVTVAGLVAPPPEYGITNIRVYRTATGFRDPKEALSNITRWYLVAQVPANVPFFVDSLNMDGLGDLLETASFRPPPAGLQQIKLIEGMGILVGFEGNRIHFSENREPHNWPLRYEITLDDNIVGIATVNGKVFVATTGVPYIIDGVPPCDDTSVRSISKSDMPLPMVSCTFGGIIATPLGAVYASTDGLVLLSESAPPAIFTQDYIGSEQWQRMRPDTAILGYYLGQVYCATEVDTYVCPLDISTFKNQTGFLSTASIAPIQMQTTPSGQLLFLDNTEVQQWDAGARMPYTWKGSTWQLNARLTAVRIVFDKVKGPVTFSISSPLKTATLTLFSEEPYRLPRLGRYREFDIELTGIAEVTELGLGATILETYK